MQHLQALAPANQAVNISVNNVTSEAAGGMFTSLAHSHHSNNNTSLQQAQQMIQHISNATQELIQDGGAMSTQQQQQIDNVVINTTAMDGNGHNLIQNGVVATSAHAQLVNSASLMSHSQSNSLDGASSASENESICDAMSPSHGLDQSHISMSQMSQSQASSQINQPINAADMGRAFALTSNSLHSSPSQSPTNQLTSRTQMTSTYIMNVKNEDDL